MDGRPGGAGRGALSSYAAALEALEALAVFGIRLGLENVRAYCASAAHPERRYPSFHVAGTNGKGTTAACLAALATRHGLRTGLYTSPHLVDLRERIRVDGRPADPDDVAAAWERIAGFVNARGMTYFEAVTLIAFEHFAAKRVDLAVLEVGMGGRLDATNVITPEAAIVTNVARDHERHLGTDLAAIAREKGGVFKPGKIALVGEPGSGEVRAALAAAGEAVGARVRFLPDEVDWRLRGIESAETRFDYASRTSTAAGGFHAEGLALPLAGAHFAANAALAIRAWELAALRSIEPVAVRAALAEVAPAGRMERHWIEGIPYFFDVAHNPAAIERLTTTLRVIGSGRCAVVAGILRDKDVAAMLDRLSAVASRVWLCGLRTARPERRLGAAEAAPLLASRPRVHWVETVDEGLSRAGEAVTAGAAEQVVVTGSFHTVGEALLSLGVAIPGEPYARGAAAAAGR